MEMQILIGGHIAKIKITDGVAILIFERHGIAKKLFKINSAQKINCEYDSKTDSYIEYYPGKKEKEIFDIIKSEIKQNGVR